MYTTSHYQMNKWQHLPLKNNIHDVINDDQSFTFKNNYSLLNQQISIFTIKQLLNTNIHHQNTNIYSKTPTLKNTTNHHCWLFNEHKQPQLQTFTIKRKYS